jgi:hypothetical protein
MVRVEIELTPDEVALVQKGLSGDGGYQRILTRMQGWLQPGTNRILVPLNELDNVVRYAFDYGKGGFQSRMCSVAEGIRALVGSVVSGLAKRCENDRGPEDGDEG